jgi:hypothetical protein
MNCHEFHNWLEDIDRSHDRSLGRAHLEVCVSPECRRMWEEHLLVEDAIAVWKQDVPQVNVIDRVWSEIEASKPSVLAAASHSSPMARSGRRAGMALALTAGIVALSLWGLSGLELPKGNHGADPIAEAPPTEEPTSDPILDPVPEPPLQKLSVASVNLAQSASAFVADAALLTVQDVGDPNDPSRPVSRWATKVSERLQPWGENLNEAFQYIDKVIPDMSMMRMMPTG